MRSSATVIVASVLLLSLLGGCAHRRAPSYEESPTWSGSRVEGSSYGVISSIETVDARQSTTGAGAVIGGVAGAVLGRQVGSGNGRTAGTVLGAVGGALIGNEIEKQQANTQDRYRLVIRLDNGATRAYNVANLEGCRVGDRVRLDGQGIYRP
ncbi:outer membrane lipoprotein [Ideonella paludis]|uniref:Glycine zipper 2TM domain-containing protein n=1 Tax=Ideonella paludis TaxID=1233411 RepID=A0ABS5E1Y3_9BURK|nr:glycine zipper 2TM domain-containing protein [Ideonella paludis]MBQ0937309.1 glycine zipper 2TM domain-containing protein [Ideonella paludis]